MQSPMTDQAFPEAIRWIHEERSEDTVRFRVGKRGDEMVADWPGVARLTCAHDGSAAVFASAPGASPRHVRKLRGAQVRALLWDLSGKLALHASAVAIEGRAVLFLGADGAGKSTAAAEMCLGHGARMLSDDATFLEVTRAGVRVLPSEGEHWLTHESRVALGVSGRRGAAKGEKRSLRATLPARDSSSLALIVSLRFGEDLAEALFRPLGGGAAARLLLNAVARFDVEDIRARHRELEQVTSVYNHAPFLELVRPRRVPGGVSRFVLEMLGR